LITAYGRRVNGVCAGIARDAADRAGRRPPGARRSHPHPPRHWPLWPSVPPAHHRNVLTAAVPRFPGRL